MITIQVPYPPDNKPPSKISPLPSLILKFLHRYVCLDYKPPSHQVDCTRTRARERVRTYVTPSFNWLRVQRGIFCIWWWLLEKSRSCLLLKKGGGYFREDTVYMYGNEFAGEVCIILYLSHKLRGRVWGQKIQSLQYLWVLHQNFVL